MYTYLLADDADDLANDNDMTFSEEGRISSSLYPFIALLLDDDDQNDEFANVDNDEFANVENDDETAEKGKKQCIKNLFSFFKKDSDANNEDTEGTCKNFNVN